MYRVTLVANATANIAAGDKVQFVVGNSPANIEVKDMTGRDVGYVANTSEEVAPHSSSATWLTNLVSKGKTGGKEVKEIWGYLSDACQMTVNGKALRRFYADLFFVQEHKKKAGAADATVTFYVGGLTAKNGGKPALTTELTKAQQAGTPAEIELLVLDKGEKGLPLYRLFRPTDKNQPVGELVFKDENDVAKKPLEKWFKTHAELSVKTTGDVFAKKSPDGTDLNGIGYSVVAEFKDVNIDTFNDAIDEAVRNAAGQDRDLREKVSYLIGEGVAKEVIELLLKQMNPACLANLPEKPLRPYSGNSDILADSLAFSILGEHIRLIGDKGSGKNTLIQTICWLRNQPMIRIQGNIQMDKLDLLGCPQLRDGQTTFELSDVMKALRDGKTVVIDEANLIRPDVLGLLHSATDEARSVLVPGYGLVRLAPSAQVVYTMNEGYQGTQDMNEATIDRTPTFELGQEMTLKTLLAGYDKQHIKFCQKISDEIRKGVQEGRLSGDAVTIRGYISACERAKYVPLKRALMYCVANKVQDSAQRFAIAGIISNVCG